MAEPGGLNRGFVADAVDGVAILLWAADPGQPQALFTPFAHAAAAAAMDAPVEVYFSSRSVQLLVAGVADAIGAGSHPSTLLDAMRQAHALGARFYACSDALRAQGLDDATLIAECSGRGGAVQFMARAIDRRWRALVF